MLDSPQAVNVPNPMPTRYSVIGNLVYKMTYSSSGTGYAIDIRKAATTEVYLNTIISASNGISAGAGSSNDVRCNVLFSGIESSGTSSQFNDNAYYGSPNANETNRIDVSVATRASAKAYSMGQIISTSALSNCVTGMESACFLYRVTSAGTSASGGQSYCTTLGCTQQDGTMRVRAIRGPYTFYRKLRTKPERYTIPYARAYAGATNDAENAPEAYACPSDYTKRLGIGIN
jgi:hypothetical protein